MTLIFIVFGARTVNSFWKRSAIPGNIVEPPVGIFKWFRHKEREGDKRGARGRKTNR